jgi:hypothetical protein
VSGAVSVVRALGGGVRREFTRRKTPINNTPAQTATTTLLIDIITLQCTLPQKVKDAMRRAPR